MRRETAHWIVAYIAVGLSAGLAAWSGVKASDAASIVDGSIKGAIMFVIAVLGCHGWGWAARTWKDGHPFWAVIAGVVLTVAMAVTLIGGAGSFYSAAAEKMALAERRSDAYRRADAEIKKIEAKRSALTPHRSKGEIEPDIIQAQADRRFKATNRCDPAQVTKSIDFCRDYRALEREKAAAEEGERLDRIAEPFNAVVGKGKPAQAGGWGALLAAAFGITVEKGNALFAFMTTVALDMGAVVAVLTAELREPGRHQDPKGRVMLAASREAEEVEPEAGEPADLLKAPRPQLVAANSLPPAGSVPKILSAILEPARGKRAEARDIHAEYVLGCQAEGKRALGPAEFLGPLLEFARRAQLKTKAEGSGRERKLYLLGVQLATASRQTA